MRDVTLKQLRSLTAVVRDGTIAAAAKQLHVTAPAVGQQLALLERSVGMKLLDRTPNGFVPTTAGRELVAAADRIEIELEACRRRLELMTAGKSGLVTLGAVSTAKYFAPQLLAAFWQSHRDIDVELVVGNRREVIAALAGYEVDIAIMGRPPEDLGLTRVPIADHPHVIIASPEHPLAVASRVRPDELEAETFLVREPGSGTRLLTEWMFTSAGIQPPIGMEIASNETIKQAVIADLGIALLSAHTVAAELADHRLVALPVDGLPIMRQWHAVRPSSRSLLPPGQAMWDFLAEHGRDHVPTGERSPGLG